MRELLVFSLIGGGTLAMRAVFILTTIRLPDSVERAMRHAKPAILAALVGGFLAGGESGITPGTVGALAVAAVLAKRGSHMLVVLSAALAVAVLLP